MLGGAVAAAAVSARIYCYSVHNSDGYSRLATDRAYILFGAPRKQNRQKNDINRYKISHKIKMLAPNLSLKKDF